MNKNSLRFILIGLLAIIIIYTVLIWPPKDLEIELSVALKKSDSKKFCSLFNRLPKEKQAEIVMKQNNYLDGYSFLSYAVLRRDSKIARFLLMNGANPNFKSNNQLPLQIAAKHKDDTMIALLKQFGAKN